MPRLMVRRGLAADLARVIHFIDLGSSEMSETINNALRPLEVSSNAFLVTNGVYLVANDVYLVTNGVYLV